MGEEARRDWWKKGRALDLWSIPHFLFGVITGMVPFLTDLSPSAALLLTCLLALGWEVGEFFFGIKETLLNSLFDIVLPIVAFVLTFQLLLALSLHIDDLRVLAIGVVAVYAFTNISGWLAFRRRAHEFRN
jgi:hypothetical protein